MPIVRNERFYIWFNLPGYTDDFGKYRYDQKRNALALVEHETKLLLWNEWHKDLVGNERLLIVEKMSDSEINECIRTVAYFMSNEGMIEGKAERLLDLLYTELGKKL